MSNMSQMTPYTKIKQSTDRDSRNFGPLVSGYEFLISTLNQTVINLSQFVVNLDRKSTVMVYVDGQLLTEGVGNDYIWSTGVNNTSNQLTLAVAIPAGLNIQIYKIGASNNYVANADTLQAGINLVLNQVDQKNSNKIINGAFDYWQRNTSFATVANATYTTDRFSYFKSGSMVHTVSRSTDVPTSSSSTYSMLVDCTTLDAAIAAGEYAFIAQKIEGNILRTFKNKSMVFAFWVKSPKTGIHCVSFQNSAQNRSMVKEYTVNIANTWERKTVRFQHDSTGTWDYTTGIGMWANFTLAAGTTFQSTAGAWQSGNFIATANQVNVCDSTSNDFYLSDIVLVEDNDTLTKIPDFCFAGRDYMEELQLCQRYYEKTYNLSVAPGAVGAAGYWENYDATGTTNAMNFSVQYKIRKRTNPAFAPYSPVTGAINNVRTNDGAADRPASVTSSGETAASISFTPSAVSRVTSFHWTADAEL